MSGYTKLFNSILASTVWSEPNDVRIVWITMLAMANKDGIVEGSVPGLAVFARLPIDVTETALARLSSPDPHSRSKEQDGRRIETIDGGWKLINHFKYRQQMSADERREYLRIKQQEQRTKKKLKTSASTARQQSSRNVNTVSDEYTKSTHTAPAPDTAPDPEAAPVPVINNQLDRKGAAPVKAANGNGSKPVNSRSKHPIFQGQRFVVFDWMLEDLGRTLGSHLDDFDIHEWFFSLDAKAVKDAIVKSKNDWWPWIQTELLTEAQKRGLPVEGPKQYGITPKTAGNAAALKRFAERRTS